MVDEFQLFPDQASTLAPQVDALYLFLVGMSAFFTVAIFLAIVFLALGYRSTAQRNRVRVHGKNLWMLEATWIVVPFIITMAIFFWGAVLYSKQRTMPPDAIEIHVVGKQWMWKVQHPQGRSEINELHVPLGQPVMLKMVSEDVIHDFYIPAFRVKMDVLPDRYHSLWFEATQEGTYHFFCAEYCGTDHADMRGHVHVMQPSAYAEWLQAGGEKPAANAGEELFTRAGCATCHVASAAGQPRCPPLQNLYWQPVQLADGQTVTADDNYLRESILNPAAKVVAGYQPVMPTFAGRLSEEEILKLIEYIKSLSLTPLSPAPGAAPAPTRPPTP